MKFDRERGLFVPRGLCSMSGVGGGSSAVRNYKMMGAVEGTIDLTNIGNDTLISVSEAGKLIGIGFRVTTAPTGTPNLVIRVTTDGALFEAIDLYSLATTWDNEMRFFAVQSGEDGSAIDHQLWIPVNCEYATSLLINTSKIGTGTAGVLQTLVHRGQLI